MGLSIAKRRKPIINLVPLIDVLTILIFFFLLTMQFRPIASLNITPPKIETAGQGQQAPPLQLGVNAKGEFFFEQHAILLKDLGPVLKRRSNQDKQTLVLIQADENVPLKYLTALMDTCREAELENLRLESR